MAVLGVLAGMLSSYGLALFAVVGIIGAFSWNHRGAPELE
jgi:hypothetical protein